MAEEKPTPIKKKSKGFHISTDIDFEIRSPKLRAMLIAVLAVLLVAFIGYHVSSGIVNQAEELNTRTAVKYTHKQTIAANAFILREEKFIAGVGVGEVVPLAEDGMKVSGNDTVANVFNNAAETQSYYALTDVLQDIDYYEAIKNTSKSNALPDITAYDKKVQDGVFSLLESLATGDTVNVPEQADNVRSAVTKRAIAIGTPVDVSPKLSALYAKRNELINAMHNYATIPADCAGYYVYSSDGYERVSGLYDGLQFNTYEKLSDGVKYIDTATVNTLLSLEPIQNNAPYGKLITGFAWYIVCSVDTIKAADLSVGDSLNVSFPESSAQTVKAEILALNADGVGKTAIVLSATAMDGKYANLRKVKILLETDSFNGLRVENTAIRTVDGEMGVYVRLGNVITFRKIEVLYSTDSFSLVKADGAAGYLKTYDEIIIEGTDLYDGKLIK